LSHGKSKKRSSKGKKIKKRPLVLDPVPPPQILVIPEHQDRCSTQAVIHTPNSNCLSEEYDKCLRDLSRLKSFKEDFAVEVADFKRSLKSFEAEFRRPKSTSSNGTQTQTHDKSQTQARCQPTSNPGQHTAERAKCRREMLRRCFSVNDLQGSSSVSNPKPSKLAQPSLSNYFPRSKDKDEEVPKIQIQSPTTSSKRSSSASTTGRGRARRGRGRKSKPLSIPKEEKPLPPLSIFELPEEPVQRRTPSVSPLHPVSRPNLAATLRAEVSRKKVKELKNNCTFHDPRPQFDWEVRKTPAWKSLSLK